jgi:hypothetical protein
MEISNLLACKTIGERDSLRIAIEEALEESSNSREDEDDAYMRLERLATQS